MINRFCKLARARPVPCLWSVCYKALAMRGLFFQISQRVLTPGDWYCPLRPFCFLARASFFSRRQRSSAQDKPSSLHLCRCPLDCWSFCREAIGALRIWELFELDWVGGATETDLLAGFLCTLLSFSFVFCVSSFLSPQSFCFPKIPTEVLLFLSL